LRREARWLVPAAALLAAVSFWLSLPPRFRVERTFRAIGRATDVRVGNHFGTWEEYRASITPRNALDSLFGQEWIVKDASRELIGVPLALIYYSDRPGPRDSVPNYIVQLDGDPPPAGYASISSLRGITTWVRDLERWRHDRSTPPPTDFRSPLYEIRRETLYRFLGIPARNYQLNLADLPGMWRFF